MQDREARDGLGGEGRCKSGKRGMGWVGKGNARQGSEGWVGWGRAMQGREAQGNCVASIWVCGGCTWLTSSGPAVKK